MSIFFRAIFRCLSWVVTCMAIEQGQEAEKNDLIPTSTLPIHMERSFRNAVIIFHHVQRDEFTDHHSLGGLDHAYFGSTYRTRAWNASWTAYRHVQSISSSSQILSHLPQSSAIENCRSVSTFIVIVPFDESFLVSYSFCFSMPRCTSILTAISAWGIVVLVLVRSGSTLADLSNSFVRGCWSYCST